MFDFKLQVSSDNKQQEEIKNPLIDEYSEKLKELNSIMEAMKLKEKELQQLIELNTRINNVVESKAISECKIIEAIEKEEKEETSDLETVNDRGEKFYLSKEQANAYYQIDDYIDNNNFFITGKAGTGKSEVLKYFRKHTDKHIAVVAPTGIAAINVEGQTIHSFFGLKATVQDINSSDVYAMRSDKINMLKSLDAIVIDEISMVRADVMDMIDAKLKYARRNNLPFGGCQIIAFGDLYQLPPVIEDDDEHVKNFLNDRYDTEFFFSAPVVKNNPFIRIELQKVHRQKDARLINTLNDIRIGENIEDCVDVVNTRVENPPINENVITVTPKRSSAEKINENRLAAINSKEYIYHGIISGNFKEEDVPTDIDLKLKAGAQIMMLKNNQNCWVNGTMGTISRLDESNIYVLIEGNEYRVEKETWDKIEYYYDNESKKLDKRVKGTFEQYPIKLSYAITIHKSQGKTFGKVCVDYSNGGAFAAGQTYVALSRCKSLDGLYLTAPISTEDIKVNEKILEYMNSVPEIIEALTDNTSAFMKYPILNSNNTISISPPTNPKKITGSDFGSLFGEDKYKSDFSTWCKKTRTYEEPFESNKYTEAGDAIEPIQINYVKKVLKENIVSPTEYFGPNPKKKMGYDFFHDNEIFGGMWDSIKQENGETIGVYEMKTTGEKHRNEWERNAPRSIPKNYLLQVALYAYLLGVDDITMVASFLTENDYNRPENFKCNAKNTSVYRFKLSEIFPRFKEQYIMPAIEWWNRHVVTGKSPKWTDKDRKIISEIRNNQHN